MSRLNRVLITGGAGFLGSHLCEHILRTTDCQIVILDRLDISGNLNRLSDIGIWGKEKHRVKFVFHDLKAAINDQLAHQIGEIDTIFHLAASTHVDRSITDPVSFVMDNVVGTAHLLEYARGYPPDRLFLFSSDEVFGPAPPGVQYKEWDRYKSQNPYSASKAGAEELGIAYHNTYGVPVVITHCHNIFGERQHAEKYVPSCIRKIKNGETITVHADIGLTKPGSRFYIHARNVAAALLFLVDCAVPGEKYNIAGEQEVDNMKMALQIGWIMGKGVKCELVDIDTNRPGHDSRYALDGSKMAAMGWNPPVSFDESLERTVNWTLAHPDWM